MRHGSLTVISGPAGAGKGTLVGRLLARVPDSWVSVSATTRPPRPGDVEGVTYHFLSEDEFKRVVAEGGFLEWAQVHGNHYGTLRSSVEEQMSAGKQVVLEIDVQGALNVRRLMPQAHLVFIQPPSIEELEHRLRGRGTETEDAIQTRMHNAKVELSLQKEYDFTIVNDNLDQATEQLVALVNSFAEEDKEK